MPRKSSTLSSSSRGSNAAASPPPISPTSGPVRRSSSRGAGPTQSPLASRRNDSSAGRPSERTTRANARSSPAQRNASAKKDPVSKAGESAGENQRASRSSARKVAAANKKRARSGSQSPTAVLEPRGANSKSAGHAESSVDAGSAVVAEMPPREARALTRRQSRGSAKGQGSATVGVDSLPLKKKRSGESPEHSRTRVNVCGGENSQASAADPLSEESPRRAGSKRRRSSDTSPTKAKVTKMSGTGVSESGASRARPAAATNGPTGLDNNTRKRSDVARQQAAAPSPPTPALDPLFNRRFVAARGGSDAGGASGAGGLVSFTVVTYNILAEFHRRKYDYGYSCEEVLSHPYRGTRFLSELAWLDGDVVCLQEVEPDYFRDTLMPALQRAGYDGLFKQRLLNFKEGEALFWKKDLFTLSDSLTVSTKELLEKYIDASEHSEEVKDAVRQYLDREAVMIIAKFWCQKAQRFICMGNIHVTWAGFEVPDIQCIQTSCAIKAMVQWAESASLPFVLCGDFNTKVCDPAYQLARDGYLNNDSLAKLQSFKTVPLPGGEKEALVNLLWEAFRHAAVSIRSTYATVQNGKEPQVTTLNGLMQECVDYMWVSGLRVEGVWQTANLTQPIPDVVFPSDHLSLKARYSIVTDGPAQPEQGGRGSVGGRGPRGPTAAVL